MKLYRAKCVANTITASSTNVTSQPSGTNNIITVKCSLPNPLYTVPAGVTAKLMGGYITIQGVINYTCTINGVPGHAKTSVIPNSNITLKLNSNVADYYTNRWYFPFPTTYEVLADKYLYLNEGDALYIYQQAAVNFMTGESAQVYVSNSFSFTFLLNFIEEYEV